MSKKIQAVRGMNDLLPKNSSLWLEVETRISAIFNSFGYKKISTPLVEKTQVFQQAIGAASDIISKEMYSWQEANGESLSLRPEGTAGVVRAMIEHNLPRDGVQKVFYQGPMFRHERPQQGRYRQFHQIGAEVFGAENAKIDAELVAITHNLWTDLGLKNLTLEINTLGSNADRQSYKAILVDYFSKHKSELDENNLRRLEQNPLRILDSKNKSLQGLIAAAPKLTEHLDDASKQHFEDFKAYLECLKIPYKINPHLVRGLDYYSRTVFEWTTDELGAQAAICAGGRYDGLVEKMGGSPTAAVGFAIGLERLILLLQAQNISLESPVLSIYLVAFGEPAQRKSMQITQKLRRALPTAILYNDVSLGSFKAQFKKADKAGADFALILGEEEISNNQISLKPLKNQGSQQTMSLEKAINYLENL